jgi:hypothetical protein
MTDKNLIFKWTVSRGRDTYGYNICSLWVNGKKCSSCNGGGYDMKGTALGNWMQVEFKDELLRLDKEYYGLSFHDPNYDAGKAEIDGETVEQREKEGKSLGLERYQAFHRASSKVPTEKHVIPLLDGACGYSCMEKVLNDMGYFLRYAGETKNTTHYILEHKGGDNLCQAG